MRSLFGFLPFLTLLLMACGNQPSANSSVATSETPSVNTSAPSSPASTAEVAPAPPPQEAPAPVAVSNPAAKAPAAPKATAQEKVQQPAKAKKAAPVKSPDNSQEKPTLSTTKAPAPSNQLSKAATTTKEVKAAATTPPATKAVVKKEEPVAPKAFTHETWDQLLRKHVSSTGKVNYKGFKADATKFNAYLEGLKNNPIQKDMPRNARMAYWINAYNAFTVKLIVDNYPVKSIMDLHGGEPWKVSWIELGDRTYSLNEIEHKILRPRFKEARIHFAVNCAAKSCPPLLNRAWTAANLNSNFQKTSKSFVNGPMNEISAKKLKLSKIFEWYGEDFDDLIGFLNEYSTTPINADAKIEFVDYDWALNE